MYNKTPVDFEQLLEDLKGFLIQKTGFELGQFFFSPFNDTTDNATSIVITSWRPLNNLYTEIYFTLEYRESLKEIQDNNPGIEPLTIFMQRCDKIGKVLTNPSLCGIGSGYNTVDLQGKIELFYDNKNRIYCHFDYKLLSLNKEY